MQKINGTQTIVENKKKNVSVVYNKLENEISILI